MSNIKLINITGTDRWCVEFVKQEYGYNLPEHVKEHFPTYATVTVEFETRTVFEGKAHEALLYAAGSSVQIMSEFEWHHYCENAQASVEKVKELMEDASEEIAT